MVLKERETEEENNMKIFTIILGILLTIGGFFCVFRPGMTFLSTGWMLGIMMFVAGLNMIAAHYTSRDKGNILSGIIVLVLGLFMIVSGLSRAVADVIILYVFGIGMIAGGISKTAGGFYQKKIRRKDWGWSLLLGIITICLGVYCFFHPLSSAYAIGYLIGFIVLVQGVNLIGTGISMEGQ